MTIPEVPQHTGLILLVEDDLFFAARLLSMLQKTGRGLRHVRSRAAAEAALREDLPALVLINLAGAKLGGLDLVREIKARPDAPRVLAYFSHTRLPAIRDEALAAGVDKLCANSAVSLRLPDLVRDVLQGRGPREEE